MTRLPPRFFRIYTVAWLPVLCAYIAFISAVSSWNVPGATLVAVANVLPGYSLGVGPAMLCRRLPWPPPTRGAAAGFLAVHALAAAAYAAAWAAGIVLLFSLSRSVSSGTLQLWRLSAGELQWQLGAGLLVYVCIASVMYLLESTRRLREEEARAARLEALQTRAELQALRAQMNPHFLFNTLHTLLELMASRDPRAEEAVEITGNLFRYAYDKRRDAAGDVLVREELAFVDDYLSVERLRLGARLHTRIEVDPRILDTRIPPLLIQPLVENAVRHAAAVQAGPCTIDVRITRSGERLHILVGDDGPGAAAGAPAARDGSGLWLVRRRLELRYGGAGDLAIDTAPGAGFRATLRVPLTPAGSVGGEQPGQRGEPARVLQC